MKYLLQIGLAFTLLFAGIDSLLHPENWIGFVPVWIENFGVSVDFALKFHAVLDIILAVFLIINKFVRPVAGIVALVILSIILVNGFGSIFLATFRDVGLFFMALYLAVDKPKQES